MLFSAKLLSERETVPTGMLFNMADGFRPAASFPSKETENIRLTITSASSYFDQAVYNTENS